MKKKKTKTTKNTGLNDSFESDSEEAEDTRLCDDGVFGQFSDTSSDSEQEIAGGSIECNGSNVNINYFVLVKLESKKTVKYFVAQKRSVQLNSL